MASPCFCRNLLKLASAVVPWLTTTSMMKLMKSVAMLSPLMLK